MKKLKKMNGMCKITVDNEVNEVDFGAPGAIIAMYIIFFKAHLLCHL